MSSLLTNPVLALVTNAPTLIDLRLPVSAAQRAFYYAIRRPNMTPEEFNTPTIPEEQSTPYSLWTLGLPTNLLSGTSYTVDFLIVESTNALADVSGPATLSIVRQSDGAPHPDASVTPAQILINQGSCRTNVQLTATSSLDGYVVALSVDPPALAPQGVVAPRRLTAATRLVLVPVILVPVAPTSPVNAFTEALAGVRAYVDAAFWSSPLDDTSPEIAGTFGEWRGHRRSGRDHDNVHAGLDLVAVSGASVLAARGGLSARTMVKPLADMFWWITWTDLTPVICIFHRRYSDQVLEHILTVE